MRVEALPDSLVVDASVGLKWVVDEPGSGAAAALVAGQALVTSALFWVEAANALATKERRAELDRAGIEDAWRDLAQAPVETVPLDRHGAFEWLTKPLGGRPAPAGACPRACVLATGGKWW